MLSNKKIGVIGVGNMGSALVHGIVESKLVDVSRIYVCDCVPAKCDSKKDLGINVVNSHRELVTLVDIVILAVKPQTIHGVLEEIVGSLSKGTLIISIAAGVCLEKYETVLVQSPVIRAMPNLPVVTGSGVVAIAPGKNATEEHMLYAKAIFNAVGKVVVVEERMMDAITAVSGSGPAYVYYFLESFIDGAVNLGLSKELAFQCVYETVLGSLQLLEKHNESPGELRKKVTSPGGTTEAALRYLDEIQFHEHMGKALEQAAKRSKELSSGA